MQPMLIPWLSKVLMNTRSMGHMVPTFHGPCIHEYFQWPEYEHRLCRQVGTPLWFSPTLPLKWSKCLANTFTNYCLSHELIFQLILDFPISTSIEVLRKLDCIYLTICRYRYRTQIQNVMWLTKTAILLCNHCMYHYKLYFVEIQQIPTV